MVSRALRAISTANCGWLRPCTLGGFLLFGKKKATKEKAAVVPRPSVNVWHVPCAKRLRSRGAFFCRDRPAAERRHNDSTPHGSAAIAGSSPALRFPWLIGGAVV